MRNTTRFAAVAALLLITAACGDDDDDAATNDTSSGGSETTAAAGDDDCAASGEDATLTISGFAFGGDVTVASGGVVAVSNEDGTTHTFTSDEAGFDCSIPGGESANVLVDAAPGEYEFHCTIHQTMTATITVE